MDDKWIEYEFTLPDGSKRYEIVSLDHALKEIQAFMKMHGAVSAVPVKRGEASHG